MDYSGYERQGANPLRAPRTCSQFPHALSHQEVSELGTFRKEAIERLLEVMNSTGPTADPADVCILTYASGQHVSVLDGNHRLAALLRGSHANSAERRLIVFQIQEIPQKERQLVQHLPRHGTDDKWFGFNPDVDLARTAQKLRPRAATTAPVRP